MISSDTQKPAEDNRINFIDALNKKHREKWRVLERIDHKKSKRIKEKERLLQRKFNLMKQTSETTTKTEKKGNGLTKGCRKCGEAGHLSFQCMNRVDTRPRHAKPAKSVRQETFDLEQKIKALKRKKKRLKRIKKEKKSV